MLGNIFRKNKIHKNDVSPQESEYEILEVTKVPLIKAAGICMSVFFRRVRQSISNIVFFRRIRLTEFAGCMRGFCRSHNIKNILVAAMAFVMVSSSLVATFTIGNHDGDSGKSADDELVAVADVLPSEQEETAPEYKAQTVSLYLEAVAEENTITAKVYGEDGNVLTGHELVFNLLKGGMDDNKEEIEKLKSVHAGQSVDGVESTAYKDDNRDGTVCIDNLENGKYTLVVQAEEGYKTPDATETCVETFAVIDNIMKKVVEDSSATQKEDPSNNRKAQADTGAANVTNVTESTTSLSGEVGVISLKKSDNNIVYKITESSTRQFSDAEISKLTAGKVVIDGGTQLTTYTGYVYETGTLSVTGGNVDVITKFLVLSDTSASETSGQTTKTSSEETSADTGLTNATTGATSDTTSDTTTDTTSEMTAETTGAQEVETQSTAAEKTYTVYTLKAETVTTYSDGWHTIDSKKYYFKNSKAVTGWNKIDGLQYYFGSDGALGSVIVIDISTYNGDIDWTKVKAAGIEYAMIRVGYRGYETAKLVKDKRFDANMQGAIAAGIKVGAYIVTQAVNTTEAVEEASFIVSMCSSYKISLPLAIDVESAGGGSGRGDKITAAERTAVINAFVQTVKNSGYTAMVYANKDWMTNRIIAGSLTAGSNVWLAQYNSACTYGGSFKMWQFTSTGSVSGISGNVDMNAWKL